MPPSFRYIPGIIRSEHDAALDALAALDIPRGEVMDLLVAGWGQVGAPILAEVDGGRPVAVVPLPDGRWAACNTFPGHASGSHAEASRNLAKTAQARSPRPDRLRRNLSASLAGQPVG
jgi:hypothetical protein